MDSDFAAPAGYKIVSWLEDDSEFVGPIHCYWHSEYLIKDHLKSFFSKGMAFVDLKRS